MGQDDASQPDPLVPELPEVDHVARYLSERLAGVRIVRLAWVEPGREVVLPFGATTIEAMAVDGPRERRRRSARAT